jgi:SWI/SNF-related matrix-associated actin-dependent regulator 1 of chromatin subfamily A
MSCGSGCDSKLFPEIEGICIINYDILDRHADIIKGTHWDIFISDEAHYLKGGNRTKRGRFVFGQHATRKEIENGAADIPGITARIKIFLTGTPIANRPAELFPLINYLDPVTWPNFWSYTKRYCAAHDNGFGWDVKGATNLQELQDKLRGSGLMIRRLKKDVLKELPPKRHQVIELEARGQLASFAASEREAYEERDDEIAGLQTAVELAKASDDPVDYQKAVAALRKGMGAIFGALSTLRMELAIAKIPLCLQHIRDAIEENGKVVCFIWHKEVARALNKEFGNEAVMLVGDTPMQERQDAVDRFQKDPAIKLFIGSITAAGVGITLTASSHVVFAEHSWVPGEMAQASDRCHRIGQLESVLIQYLVVEGSLDATMAKRIVEKQVVIDRALDKNPEGEIISLETRVGSGQSKAPAYESPSREAINHDAATITRDQQTAAHEAVRFLAGRCNGASDWDGAGFSKLDTMIGKSLAAQPFLTPKQAVLAKRIAIRYSKTQLPAELANRLR